MVRGQTQPASHKRTSRLLDRIGSVGRFDESYKTQDTLARHTNSEEHSKVKTKLELKMYMQNEKNTISKLKLKYLHRKQPFFQDVLSEEMSYCNVELFKKKFVSYLLSPKKYLLPLLGISQTYRNNVSCSCLPKDL